MARKQLITDVLQFHRPWLLNIYAAINFAVALFYGLLGTTEMLRIVYGPGPRTISFENAMELSDRSLMHSGIAGLALLGGFVMTTLARIAASNHAPNFVWDDWFRQITSARPNDGQPR